MTLNTLALRLLIERGTFALCAFLLVAQAALVFVPRSDGHLLSSDGGYYYSYMRSTLLDADLDITNDIDLYNRRVPRDSNARLMKSYAFSVGPAVLWTPFFLLGHAVAHLLAATGIDIRADGYSSVEEGFVSFGSVIYACLAIILMRQAASNKTSRNSGTLSTLAVFLSSACIYYTIFEPTMSHSLELFATSLFFYIAIVRRGESLLDFAMLGASAGLVFLVRWQDVVLFIAAVPHLTMWLRNKHVARVTGLMVAAIVGSITILPQFVFWKITSGHFITVPQGQGFLNITEPQIAEVLLSLRHGLLSWHPALMLCVLGLGLIRPKSEAWFYLAAVALDIYVCSIVRDWWGGESFGMRRMIGATPLFVLGLARIYEIAEQRRSYAYIQALIVPLVAWNFLFMVQYRLGFIPADEPPTWQQFVVGKFELPSAVMERFKRK